MMGRVSDLPAAVRRLALQCRVRMGRRGAALLVFAFIDTVIGWSLLDGDSQALVRAAPAYRAIVQAAPLHAWAGAWLAVAAVCAVQAFARQGQDRYGFGAAIAVKLAWALGFAGAWVLYGAPRAWLAAATWVVLAALVLVCAGWPEPGGRR